MCLKLEMEVFDETQLAVLHDRGAVHEPSGRDQDAIRKDAVLGGHLKVPMWNAGGEGILADADGEHCVWFWMAQYVDLTMTDPPHRPTDRRVSGDSEHCISFA